MKKVFIDTDIIIDYSKGYRNSLQELLDQLNENKSNLFVNSIVIAEYFTDKNLINNKKLIKAKEFFLSFEVLAIEKQVGLIAGELMRNNEINVLSDSLIAATCLHYDLNLATRNKKDFMKVKRLRFFNLE